MSNKIFNNMELEDDDVKEPLFVSIMQIILSAVLLVSSLIIPFTGLSLPMGTFLFCINFLLFHVSIDIVDVSYINKEAVRNKLLSPEMTSSLRKYNLGFYIAHLISQFCWIVLFALSFSVLKNFANAPKRTVILYIVIIVSTLVTLLVSAYFNDMQLAMDKTLYPGKPRYRMAPKLTEVNENETAKEYVKRIAKFEGFQVILTGIEIIVFLAALLFLSVYFPL